MQILGKIFRIFETQQVSQSFKKREFVVEYAENPQYPQYIKFEAVQDKCNDLDLCKVGDTVEISFNIKGRKWVNQQNQEVFFNSLDAWRITKLEENKMNDNKSQSEQQQSTTIPSVSPTSEEDSSYTDIDGTDDIPF